MGKAETADQGNALIDHVLQLVDFEDTDLSVDNINQFFCLEICECTDQRLGGGAGHRSQVFAAQVYRTVVLSMPVLFANGQQGIRHFLAQRILGNAHQLFFFFRTIAGKQLDKLF